MIIFDVVLSFILEMDDKLWLCLKSLNTGLFYHINSDLETRREDKTIVEPPMSDEIIPPEAKDAEVPLKALFKVMP